MQAKKLFMRIAVLSVLGVALSMTAYNTSVKANAHLESERAAAAEATEEAPKSPYTFEEIMQRGHNTRNELGITPLLTKLKDGEATDKEKKQLLAYYIALENLEVTKGDAESWKEKTEALTAAMINVLAGIPEGMDQLNEASNCRACHTAHRPD